MTLRLPAATPGLPALTPRAPTTRASQPQPKNQTEELPLEDLQTVSPLKKP
jgi:hypothetical protein